MRTLQARWPYPRNHFYLCLLVARSFAMLRYVPLAISCLPYCHEPLTHLVLANRCLAMLPLCSAPLIALLVAGEVEVVPCRNMDMLGYHNISYLINASIYLVKGGRLGLMPSVLFHSCRPSFPSYRYYVPWVCVPYAVGWFMGPPWQFALNKTPPARHNLGFTICLT